MAEITKQKLTSMNIKEAQLQKLKELFPEAFTEGLKVDWDKLRLTLGDETVDTGKERYGMNWPGKADCFKTIQQPSIATLIPCPQESMKADGTPYKHGEGFTANNQENHTNPINHGSDNLFIEGDNLEVLKLLQKSYLGKIKMISIDPPYNTGNDFIYPDNYSENLDTYLEYTGQIDGQGRKFATNTETDGRFHSKWMNMMYPRLFLAKNLLKEDGVIFISIDDSEVQNLKNLCNEIFGEENFIATFIWEKRTNRENRKIVSARHDYILCYCRDASQKEKAITILPMSEEAIDRYKNPDNDHRGNWKSDPATAQAGHGTKNQFYVLYAPNGKAHHLQSGRCWLYTKEVMDEEIKDNRIWFGKDGNGVPRIKTYFDSKERGLTPESIWFAADASTNESAKKHLKWLFDGHAVFETPKPVELIEIEIQLGGDNGIVLDFFAGSAATAEAVLKSTKGNSFILVQLPELCVQDSEAYKLGYKTIADISKERIRKAISIQKLAQEDKDIKAKQTLFSVSQDKLSNDFGFKVFKLQKSNFKVWDTSFEKSTELIQQKLFEHIQHISPEAQQEAILYELLLKSGFELTTPIEALTLAGKTVFSIADGQLLICLEKEITHDCIKAMAEKEPSRVICLDEAFTGINADALKTNAVQIMKSKGVVNFRTV